MQQCDAALVACGLLSMLMIGELKLYKYKYNAMQWFAKVGMQRNHSTEYSTI